MFETLLPDVLVPAAKLIASAVLALPTAIDREVHGRSLGLRTFPMVALGSCAFVMVGVNALGPEGNVEATARLLQGLMSGIGFVGGGAILKSSDNVHGTASAAGIWVTGAMGAAVGFDQWVLAVTLAVVNFGLLAGLSRIKRETTGVDC